MAVRRQMVKGPCKARCCSDLLLDDVHTKFRKNSSNALGNRSEKMILRGRLILNNSGRDGVQVWVVTRTSSGLL